MKSLIMLQASAEQPLNGQFTPPPPPPPPHTPPPHPDTLLGVLLFIRAEIKVNPCQ